jgi:hypothetical protein
MPWRISKKVDLVWRLRTQWSLERGDDHFTKFTGTNPRRIRFHRENSIRETIMKPFLTATIVVLSAGAAFAQTASPPAHTNPSTPAVTTPSTTTPAAPAAGANSFTEAQARSRIEGAGYSDVSKLAKDKDGVWRGNAMKAGTSSAVSLDYQGNVVSGK